MPERKKILIIAKTNPLPSEKYKEIVCTAGIDTDGNLIRLYPFPFRSMTHYQQFKKYQWIEVDTEKNNKDPRPESYKAFPSSLVLGDQITDWNERRSLILRNSAQTMCGINAESKRTGPSLAIVEPKVVTDLLITPCQREWSAKEKNILQRDWLGVSGQGPQLKKLPYEFKYKYYCHHDHCNGHEQTIEDWEISALYWNLIHRGDKEDTALKKIKIKYFNTFCSEKHNLYFFVGMHSCYPSWLIIGVFYPPNKFLSEIKGQTTFWSYLK